MKKLLCITGCAVLMAILMTPYAAAHGSIDITVFRTSLTPYGAWVEVAEFGTVWAPRYMPLGWRPYTLGHWIYTDYGWTWVSDLPWGWAPFHYGRWAFTPEWGWVWVPDTIWGPAWVTWRYGGGTLGWAPLSPSYLVGRPATASVFEFGILEEHWVFVDPIYFLRPRINIFVLPPSRNITLLNRTTNITVINVVEDRVINRGPAIAIVERLSRSKVRKIRVQAVGLKYEKTPSNKLEGLTYKVVRPDFPKYTASKPSAAPGKRMEIIKRLPERKYPSTRGAIGVPPRKDYGKSAPDSRALSPQLNRQPGYSEKTVPRPKRYGEPEPYAPKQAPPRVAPKLKTQPSDHPPIELHEPAEGGGVSPKSGSKPLLRSYGGALFK